MPWIWASLVVLLISGVILIVGEPARDLPNSAFQLKMALLISVIVVTLVFQHTVRRNANFWDLSPAHRHSAKVTAGVSMALWVAIAVCGRFIAYIDAQH
jgi:ABC-type sulfate transport system permease component